MDKYDLEQLWSLPWLSRNLRRYYSLDPRRHLRWDRHMRAVYYIVRRSAPRGDNPGRFAVDRPTVYWLEQMADTGRIERAYVALVEDWRAPPQVVYYDDVGYLWDRLKDIEPLSGTDDSKYWWLDDKGEPSDMWLGPMLDKPPF